MSTPRLPDGFAVQIDRRVKAFDSGAALLGGSPTRLLRLSPTARALLGNGRLEVRDAVSADLARTLLDATVAHPRPSGGPSYRDVTVVIPVRDNLAGLRRLLAALRGLRVVIVDDGSSDPPSAAHFGDSTCEITIVRHERGRGPAAARNTGLRHCRNDFVAFLDSDVVPRRGWLEALLGHFCDPAVALVAPRIVALDGGANLLARYEAAQSALDLGEREAPVVPYGRVAYVPSAAMICRRSAILAVGGFDESLAAGEDVDLCWRLLDSGSRLRYEPVAMVSHEHRSRLREWLARRVFYGTAAAPLSRRHPDKTAPLVVSVWSLLAWLPLALGLGWEAGRAGAVVFVARSARRMGPAVGNAGVRRGEAVVLALRGLGGAAQHLSAAVCRPYWPAALLAAVVSRRCRRAVLAALAVDSASDWFTRRAAPDADVAPLGPLAHTVLNRLDDCGYGAGVWAGAVRERTLRPLKPAITR